MIEFLDENTAINKDPATAFTFEVLDRKREENQPWSPLDVFSGRPFVSRFGDWNVFPYGENNNLPLIVRNIIYSNSIVPGIIGKKTGINWGRGPMLYKEKFNNGAYEREYVQDKEVQKWLDSWDWEKYAMKCAVDFSVMESFFTKFVLKKGWRLGQKPFVHSLEHLTMNKPMVVGKLNTPTHIIVVNHDNPMEYMVYPMFDKFNVSKAGLSILYSNLPSFCTDFFTIPQILGSIPWIIQSTNVPKFLSALVKNSINIKYHITSPMGYWDRIRDKIKDEHPTQEPVFVEKKLKLYKRKLLKEIKTVLSGIENAGKFWHSEQVLEDIGGNLHEMGWEIKTIDQKLSDTVTANIQIANFADKSTSTGVGIGGTLGNVSEGGRANGGSEQYYAFNNYLQSGIDLPERVMMEGFNAALKINFPEKELKMGLYHEGTKRQEEMSKTERNKIAG